MFSSPEFWVAVAFVIFVAAAARPVSRQIFAALDARGARIRAEIEEVQALREEAQKLLAESKRKHRDAIKEAEEILDHAKVEAARLSGQAQQDLEAALRRREQAAMDKISQAEAKALQEVRNQAVEVALAATANLIAANLDRNKHAAIVDQSIRDVADKLR
ncbi:MAG TPA: F0F1 ATP synthase subunit B [Kiloniellales bacterium]